MSVKSFPILHVLSVASGLIPHSDLKYKLAAVQGFLTGTPQQHLPLAFSRPAAAAIIRQHAWVAGAVVELLGHSIGQGRAERIDPAFLDPWLADKIRAYGSELTLTPCLPNELKAAA